MTIVLSVDAERRLKAEASRRGISTDELAAKLIEAALPSDATEGSNQSSIEILNDWETETATDDPEEIARRQVEFEQFKNEMNQTRLATDGADARIPFP